ncbi:MAG: hypothetical protein EBR40_11805, partial [Proteobacteria bacterium]|nr:hypothetical protein [Pseudomonadota bacterium]
SIWRIEQGVDFKTHPLMMERIIRTRATARKAKIVLRHEPHNAGIAHHNPFGYIVFQRTDVPSPWRAVPKPVLSPEEMVKVHEQFALVDATPVRSKRPVRPREDQ